MGEKVYIVGSEIKQVEQMHKKQLDWGETLSSPIDGLQYWTERVVGSFPSADEVLNCFSPAL